MISVCQIKAGRVMLGWSAVELSERAGVSSATIRSMRRNLEYLMLIHGSLTAIKSVLEQAGIEFTGDPSGQSRRYP